jgi:hypothetical protein
MPDCPSGCIFFYFTNKCGGLAKVAKSSARKAAWSAQDDTLG